MCGAIKSYRGMRRFRRGSRSALNRRTVGNTLPAPSFTTTRRCGLRSQPIRRSNCRSKYLSTNAQLTKHQYGGPRRLSAAWARGNVIVEMCPRRFITANGLSVRFIRHTAAHLRVNRGPFNQTDALYVHRHQSIRHARFGSPILAAKAWPRPDYGRRGRRPQRYRHLLAGRRAVRFQHAVDDHHYVPANGGYPGDQRKTRTGCHGSA